MRALNNLEHLDILDVDKAKKGLGQPKCTILPEGSTLAAIHTTHILALSI
ncbi:hypothetical protein C2G38_2222501 [Gigaspora rosea]|uniref:Uncharacterized protein n=1 Tax=Gigaspora rosea TaxID=44941 RepID=A0A397U5R7_9GLOM|nr:hypothetical protein C2G38_2222501 [Gigaspora rosea]